MYFSFSDGREIFKTDMCAHCQLNTGGEHEKNCPLFNHIIAKGDIFGKININYFDIADMIIGRVYPDVFKKGRGWWGAKRIPNFGILRGAIAKALSDKE